MIAGSITPVTVLDGVDAVRTAAGSHLGTSRWMVVDQERVDRFVAATGDPDHTYLVLSLTNGLLPEVVEVRGVSMGLNLGTNQVRFPAPVPVGSRVRIDVALTDVRDVVERGSEPADVVGVQTTMTVTVEVDDGDQPAAVVEVLSRFLT